MPSSASTTKQSSLTVIPALHRKGVRTRVVAGGSSQDRPSSKLCDRGDRGRLGSASVPSRAGFHDLNRLQEALPVHQRATDSTGYRSRLIIIGTGEDSLRISVTLSCVIEAANKDDDLLHVLSPSSSYVRSSTMAAAVRAARRRTVQCVQPSCLAPEGVP